jgi:hypothetical protein
MVQVDNLLPSTSYYPNNPKPLDLPDPLPDTRDHAENDSKPRVRYFITYHN